MEPFLDTGGDNLITLTTKIDDLKLNMVMNTSAFFLFTLTPEFHSHPCYEVIAAVDGEFRVEQLYGETIEMRPGTLCIIPPGHFHATSSESELHGMMVMRFSHERTKGEPTMFDTFDTALTNVSGAAAFSGASHLTDLMMSIQNELMSRAPATDAMVHSLMTCLYIGIMRLLIGSGTPLAESHSFRGDDSKSRYFRIDRWFSEHHAENVTEDDLARELNLSKRQLSRVLRSIYNMSFRELLVEIRLYRAMKLLTQSDLSIDNIAARVGYTTPTGFRRAFIKRFGKTAGEYRRQYALKAAK